MNVSIMIYAEVLQIFCLIECVHWQSGHYTAMAYQPRHQSICPLTTCQLVADFHTQSTDMQLTLSSCSLLLNNLINVWSLQHQYITNGSPTDWHLSYMMCWQILDIQHLSWLLSVLIVKYLFTVKVMKWSDFNPWYNTRSSPTMYCSKTYKVIKWFKIDSNKKVLKLLFKTIIVQYLTLQSLLS